MDLDQGHTKNAEDRKRFAELARSMDPETRGGDHVEDAVTAEVPPEFNSAYLDLDEPNYYRD
jgi:hypothetical protein